MKIDVKQLIRYVVNKDMTNALKAAEVVLRNDKTAKEKQFCEEQLRKLETQKSFVELPYDLRGILVVEDMSSFPEQRFLLRTNEQELAGKLIALRNAYERLNALGIAFLPTMLLHGTSGCGKTELARWLAHKVQLPFAYVRFSNLISSNLGGTQKNLAKVFDYVRGQQCVLCFDEIDTIGLARGQKDDVGEMNRIVISLMQELDHLNNGTIIIGTTNRFDRLDPALVRRFYLKHEVMPLSREEGIQLATMFFSYSGIQPEGGMNENWYDQQKFDKPVPAHKIVERCTEVIVQTILQEAPNFGRSEMIDGEAADGV